MEVIFLELAARELEAAFEYYEQEQLGLGIRFKTEVLHSVARIQEFPEAYQKLSDRTRRCLIAKFPYGIVYQYLPSDSKIVIVAVANLHREPYFWVNRKA